MFNGKRIEELEDRIKRLEALTQCKTGEKEKTYLYGFPYVVDKEVPINQVIEKIICVLGLKVVVKKSQEESFEIVKSSPPKKR